ncbi:ABC transporter ATP-binding protein [uncultured Paracoccus sp.]|uniref:ABC transporter ATP-binding protein n=1 Tax=uncultured Paracoccus sp. TaxID=189685 RepID=UPI00261756A6|nr:ABC transporter ATP-binding protein [uncultured Paracoccus sp.]
MRPAASPSGLVLSGLTVRRGEATVLRDVSLSVPAGRFVALIGPNGAGKTTLLRAAMGLIPAHGTSNLARLPAGARARAAAFLPQGRDVAWPVRVEMLVRLGRRPHPDRRADDRAVAAAMERLELGDLGGRIATELSGGELARVLIARLLAQDTPVILADEPIAGLDPAHQFGVMQVFADLAREGRTVVVSLHDLSLAARYCDRLILLDRGRLTADGPPGQVLTPERLNASFGIAGGLLPSADGPVFVPAPLHGSGTGG